MKYLIVGLGNPGAKYSGTRHNIGFITLDAFAKASSVVFEPARYGDKCLIKYKGRQIHLVKPNTFMNLSGKAVRYWMTQEKIPLERILIITDDLSLPFGKLRLRGKGSDGGHNGLKNINELLGRQDYPRLRFGIGSDFAKGRQVDYVLSEWTGEESRQLKERIELVNGLVHSFCTIGLSATMSEYNGK